MNLGMFHEKCISLIKKKKKVDETWYKHFYAFLALGVKGHEGELH